VRCRAGPLRAGRPLRGGYTGFALGLPLVGLEILFQRPTGALTRRGYTRHEVTAPRAGGPAGRPSLLPVGWQVSDLVLSHVGTCDELVILRRS
jgi:hypothetical protein